VHWRTLAALVTAAFIVSDAGAQPLGIGTNPQGTMVYTLGATLSKALMEHANMQSRVQPSSGTGTMVPLVNSGEIDTGFCNAREFYDSFHGVGSSDKRTNPNLRTMAVLFPLQVGLLVRNDSAIKSTKDLKGRSVSYGYASQEVIRILLDALLANAGITIADMKPVMVPNLVRGIDELIAGRVEVSFFAIGPAKIAEADASVGVRFLALDSDPAALEAMQKVAQVAYTDKVTPAPNLAGVREPILVAHYDYVAFANKGLPNERVKTIVRILAEQSGSMAQSLPLFRQLKPERMYSAKLQVPYHDGAVAYYNEKGIKQAQ
jgi:uncharacterized protein